MSPEDHKSSKEVDERRWGGLSPNVIRLGIVSLLTDISSEMIYPVTPIFLTSVLNAPMEVVGLIEGVAEATASIVGGISGFISDKIRRRRPLVFIGYFLSAISKLLIAAAGSWRFVLGARVSDRLGKGIRVAPRDALLSESVDDAHRGKAFGWHRAFDTIGAVAGPLAALVLLRLEVNIRHVFAIAFIPAIAGVLVIPLVREMRGNPKTIVQGEADKTKGSRALPSIFKRYLAVWSIFSLTNSSNVFLILKAKEVGYSVVGVTAIYALYNAVYAAMSPYLGSLSDRLGRRSVLGSGFIVFAMVYIGFAFASSRFLIASLFMIYGIYMAATDGVAKAFAIDLVGRERRATAIGIMGGVTGISTLLASSVAGWLWESVGSYAVFLYGAAGAIVGAVGIYHLSPTATQPNRD